MANSFVHLAYRGAVSAAMVFLLALLPLIRAIFVIRGGLRQKSVLIVGSAPTASLDSLNSFDYVFGVHASPLQLGQLGLHETHGLLVDASLFNAARRRTDSGKSVVWDSGVLNSNPHKVLVAVFSNNIRPTESLKKSSTYSRLLRIHNPMRRLILWWASRGFSLEPHKGASLVGTGGFAVAYAFFAGAKSVQITGFNLRSGTKAGTEFPQHFYDSLGMDHSLYEVNDLDPDRDNSKPRGHSAADALLISALYLNGRDIHSNEPDLWPLLSN